MIDSERLTLNDGTESWRVWRLLYSWFLGIFPEDSRSSTEGYVKAARESAVPRKNKAPQKLLIRHARSRKRAAKFLESFAEKSDRLSGGTAARKIKNPKPIGAHKLWNLDDNAI